ncbi:TPA: hypothetical protein EYP75_03745 [Candidatus Bathyarchaeota archaeon]|nr:hypothetical protein [Candidatus Bathyarchaeota archaeon]
MNIESLVIRAIDDGDGVLRLAPTWVPRDFLSPGGRLKLAPKDLYALGVERGGIDERWLASTTKADNPGAPEDEGLSYIVIGKGANPERILLRDAINEVGEEIIGKHAIRRYGGWTVLTKFFDNSIPIPFHLHQMEKHAHAVGQEPKPEAYYFPPQLNLNEGKFPYSFLGLNPDTTKDDIKECLKKWDEGDNGILYHSKAYKLKPGAGWLIPAGILHAPGTFVTYEVQKASDVFAMYQSMLEGRPVPRELLVKNVLEDRRADLDYIVDMIDWEANVDPYFKKHHYIEPKFAENPEETKREGYIEKWIVYASEEFSAKELTVFPESEVVIKDSAAYGLIVIQGYGRIGKFKAEAPSIIRYGELTNDETFVTEEAAKAGIKIINESPREDLVVLKHFGPGNPETPKTIG